jgi:hypothetical protein
MTPLKNLLPLAVGILFITAVFTSCGEAETRENIIDIVEGTSSTGTTDPAETSTPSGSSATESGNSTTDSGSSSSTYSAPSTGSIDGVFNDFMSCKDNSTERASCKEFPAKAICTVYGISDLMNGEDSYVKYDELLANLDMSKWEKVGQASDQSALDKAQAAANEGRAAFAIDEGDQYGNIAIILAGEAKRSTKWGLDCPNSASMFMGGHKYSYMNKGLNYAWKDNSDVYVYVRK